MAQQLTQLINSSPLHQSICLSPNPWLPHSRSPPRDPDAERRRHRRLTPPAAARCPPGPASRAKYATRRGGARPPAAGRLALYPASTHPTPLSSCIPPALCLGTRPCASRRSKGATAQSMAGAPSPPVVRVRRPVPRGFLLSSPNLTH